MKTIIAILLALMCVSCETSIADQTDATNPPQIVQEVKGGEPYKAGNYVVDAVATDWDTVNRPYADLVILAGLVAQLCSFNTEALQPTVSRPCLNKTMQYIATNEGKKLKMADILKQVDEWINNNNERVQP